MSGEHEKRKKNLMNSAGWSLPYTFSHGLGCDHTSQGGARNKGQWVKRYFLTVKGSNSRFSDH